MAHVDFSYERSVGFYLLRRHRIYMVAVELGHDRRKYLGDGIGSKGPLAEDIFMSGDRMELHNAYSGTLLTAVVLFLHQEVELVERPGV